MARRLVSAVGSRTNALSMRLAATRYVPEMRFELRDDEWRIDKVGFPSHGRRLLR